MSPSSPETGPYGELITTTIRVLTWNVWGRFGPWQERVTALIGTLEALAPDVVALQEAWCDRGGQDQATQLAKALGYRLCQCEFPPNIMLLVGHTADEDRSHVYRCPKCKRSTPGQVAWTPLGNPRTIVIPPG